MVVEGQYSRPCDITWGPSRLSPIFLVYINDIATNIHNELRLFADDILIYISIGSESDQKILQDDLTALMKWADMKLQHTQM